MPLDVFAAAPALCGVDLEALSQAERVEALAASERQLAQLAAFQQKAIAALARHASASGDALDPGGKQWVREDVAAVLRLSSGAARLRLEHASALVEQLPATLASMEAGDIGLRHAVTLVDAVHLLDEVTAGKVETRVLARAGSQSVVNFRASVERAVLALDRRDPVDKHDSARSERHVRAVPDVHGMTNLRAYLPAEDAQTLVLAVQAAADRDRAAGNVGDDRTADQRRADALTALAEHALNGRCSGADAGTTGARQAADDTVPAATVGVGPTTLQGRRPGIQVTVAMSTLLGCDDHPAELDGYGPITAAHARRIAADPSSTWYRLITDGTGKLLDYGQTRYRPPQALKDHVTARDQRCRFPHCTRRARACELDHVIRFGDGPTAVCNLIALCSRHHHLKHEAGWHVTGDADGTLVWTSPLGHVYTSDPEPLPHGKQDPTRLDPTTLAAPAFEDDIDPADRRYVDAWLDDWLREELVATIPPPTDWLTDNLPVTATTTPNDDPPPF